MADFLSIYSNYKTSKVTPLRSVTLLVLVKNTFQSASADLSF
ncbi:hypothetical protein APA_1464 [Pseudanabaena sp. lw0831]|nr:hypothetical protein APA_1464 [Pseudanabaena sp. lw0831]